MSTLTSIQIDDEIKTQVKHIIASQLHISEDLVELTHDMVTDLKIDSLDSVQILIELETFFGITIPQEQINLKGRSLLVKDIVTIVNCLILAKPEEEQETLFQKFIKLLVTNDD